MIRNPQSSVLTLAPQGTKETVQLQKI